MAADTNPPHATGSRTGTAPGTASGTSLCNLNGTILPEAEARIPVLDRGFLFGDSVYEVIRTRSGIPFAWREHLQRLRDSAAAIALDLGHDDAELMRRVQQTLAAAANPESYIRIIVTRGTGTAPNIDVAYAPGPATVVILVRPLPPPASATAHLAIVARLRTDRRALDPAVKSGNYLNNVLGLMEAKRVGASDSLFLNGGGHVTEASTSNVHVVRAGHVLTPPANAGILLGVTRALLLQHCAEVGIPMQEHALTEADVRTADEVFLSSTLRDVLPVAAIDGQPVRGGAPGPLTRELMRSFEAFCERKLRQVDAPALAALASS